MNPKWAGMNRKMKSALRFTYASVLFFIVLVLSARADSNGWLIDFNNKIGNLYKVQGLCINEGGRISRTYTSVKSGETYPCDDLSGIDMRGTRLQAYPKDILKNAVVTANSFNNARLHDMDFSFAIADSADFYGANFTRTTAASGEAHFDNSLFYKACFCDAKLSNATFEGAEFRGAGFNAATELPFSHAEAQAKGMILYSDQCENRCTEAAWGKKAAVGPSVTPETVPLSEPQKVAPPTSDRSKRKKKSSDLGGGDDVTEAILKIPPKRSSILADRLEVCFALDRSQTMDNYYDQVGSHLDKLKKDWEQDYPKGTLIHLVEFPQSQTNEAPAYRGAMQSVLELSPYLKKNYGSLPHEYLQDAIDLCARRLQSHRDSQLKERTQRLIIAITDEEGFVDAKSKSKEFVLKEIIERDSAFVILNTKQMNRGCQSLVSPQMAAEDRVDLIESYIAQGKCTDAVTDFVRWYIPRPPSAIISVVKNSKKSAFHISDNERFFELVLQSSSDRSISTARVLRVLRAGKKDEYSLIDLAYRIEHLRLRVRETLSEADKKEAFSQLKQLKDLKMQSIFIGALGITSEKATLIKYLEVEDRDVRNASLIALSQLEDRTLVLDAELLQKLMTMFLDPTTRASALEAFAAAYKKNPEWALKLAGEMENWKSTEDRTLGLEWVKRLELQQAQVWVLENLKSSDGAVLEKSIGALLALSRVSVDSARQAIEVLKRTKPETPAAKAFESEFEGQKEFTKLLVREWLLKSLGASTGLAKSLLAKRTTLETLPFWLVEAKSGRAEDRDQAARALGELSAKSPEALKVLRGLSHDSDSEVRGTALIAVAPYEIDHRVFAEPKYLKKGAN